MELVIILVALAVALISLVVAGMALRVALQMEEAHRAALTRIQAVQGAHLEDVRNQEAAKAEKRLWLEREKVNALRDSLWREAAALSDTVFFIASMHRRYDKHVWEGMTTSEQVDAFVKHMETAPTRERPPYERNPLVQPS